MFKRILSVILTLVLLSCPLTVNGATIDAIGTNQFTLTIVNDDTTNIDMSGIEIDVYSSVLSSYDPTSEVSEYTHTYAFSVNTDSRGKVNFTRPSENFLIMIDLSTLPQNTGIDVQTKFYRNNIHDDVLYVTEIDDVILELNEMAENGVSVIAFDKQDDVINAHYTIEETTEKLSTASLLSSSSQILSGKVYIGDFVESYSYEVEYDEEQKMSMVETALKKNSITKTEALNYYIDYFEEYGRSPELYERVSSLTSDSAWFETLSSAQQSDVNVILSAPSYNQEYKVGNFIIRYNSSSSAVPTYIQSVMTALQASDTSLVTGLSLNRPKSNWLGTAKYHVYVTSDSSTSAAYTQPETHLGIRTSYIVIPNITDLTQSLDDFMQGTVAHEYLHAITHDYRSSGELPSWFKEAWADWAAVRVFGIDATDTWRVNNYLDNTWKSLTSNEITYGKFLYPLYIRQVHGGDTTVANVIKNLSSTADVKTAITNALPGSNTFDSIFPAYMRFNYAPKTFYSTYLSGWSDRPFLSSDYPLNGYPNNAGVWNVNPYAAHYREFAVPTGTTYHLDITINLTESSSTFSGKLLMNGSSGVITNWNFTVSGTLVTYSTNIGASYVKGGLMLVDSGNDAVTGYRITIARS